MPKRPKPIVLTVLDGWGYRAETKGNAIALARKPNYDRLLKDFPNTLIQTSGPSVGLPEGQMGNSEVGHMNMGAGRIIHMDITRIDQMIANGEFFKQPLLLEAMERGRARNLHLLGLLSDGGVHSHMQHLYALLRMAREQHVERVFHPLLHGWPRHAAAQRRRIHPAIAAENARDRLRAHRIAHRPLLRDGSRQPLGARGARLSRRGSRRFPGEIRGPGRGCAPQLRARRHR